MRFPILTVLAALLASVTFAPGAYAQGLGRGAPDRPVRDWPTARADTMGLNTEALRTHLERCQQSGASACLLAYKGYIVQQWYRPSDYQPYLGTASAVKSWTGLLAGILIADGAIESIDDPVAKYVPEWTSGATAGVTVRHLLTMTSGLRDHTGGEITAPSVNRPHDNDDLHPGVVAAKNTTGYVLDLHLDWEPDERFSYSNEGVQLLSPILERAAGMPLARYARERLFDPLAMDSTRLTVDEYYNTVTFGGAETSLHDFAKIGQLMLNEGHWNGRQIVPASWIEQSTTPSPTMSNYGFLWWIDTERANFAAAGALDRVCIVFPDLDLIAARLQRAPRPEAKMRYQGVETLDLLRSIVTEPSTDSP